MLKNLKNKNLSANLASNKALQAMLGEEEEAFEQETNFGLTADTYGDNAETDNADTFGDEFEAADTPDAADNEFESGTGEDDWESEEDDLLVLRVIKREARLSKGEYPARIGTVAAEKMSGKDGSNWVKVTLPFEIRTTSGMVTVPFIASMSLSPKGRFYPVIKGILGHEPQVGINLRELQGVQVMVQIDHRVDDQGSVWEEVKRVKRVS